jgi:tetratricopeptide (TPR) repeat protein
VDVPVIDRDIHLARALLIEGNAMMRSIGATQLRDAGVGHVSTAGRARDARLMLERERYDIVVCSRDLGGKAEDGQQLLDELRRENLIPYSTVFLMVSDFATYNQVVEAAESALDGLLVRPHTAALFGQRLTEARKRKRELAELLRALDAGDTEAALSLALQRFRSGLPYATYCGRLAAELLMTAQRHGEACKVFAELADSRKAAWARLGVARAQMADGDMAASRATVNAVLADEPDSADAHDLSGRLHVEQCDFEAALDEYLRAAELTPGCLLRAQHAGALAFYLDRTTEARQRLERALGMGVQSKLFDALSLVLLALLRFDAARAEAAASGTAADTTGVVTLREQLAQFVSRFPDSARLRRLEAAGAALVALLAGANEPALAMLRGLAREAGDDEFDLEAANLALLLWARLPEALRPADEFDALVEQLAMRFSVSRAIGEVLVAAARPVASAQATIRRCQARVAQLAEQALERAMGGAADAAVRDLLAHGQATLNAKLLELAARLARRYASTVEDHQALAAQAVATVQRACRGNNHIAGIQRSGRSPGGLQMRGRNPTEVVHATA